MIQRVQSFICISAIAMLGSLASCLFYCFRCLEPILLYAFSIADSSALLFSETTPFIHGSFYCVNGNSIAYYNFLYSKRSLQMRITI